MPAGPESRPGLTILYNPPHNSPRPFLISGGNKTERLSCDNVGWKVRGNLSPKNGLLRGATTLPKNEVNTTMRHKAVKLLTILLLSSITVLAQGGGRPGPGGPKPSRINFLATVLSLTDDQKQEATAIFDAAEQASTSLRDSLRQQRQALNDAAKASAADSQIDQLAAALGDLTGQLASIQTKAFAKFYALLTTDQRTKLDQLQANGRGMMGPPTPFGPGLP
jgi:Spy/CpxP family protein refolding chaperone